MANAKSQTQNPQTPGKGFEVHPDAKETWRPYRWTIGESQSEATYERPTYRSRGKFPARQNNGFSTMKVELHINGRLNIELTPETALEKAVLAEMLAHSEKGKVASIAAKVEPFTDGTVTAVVSIEK